MSAGERFGEAARSRARPTGNRDGTLEMLAGTVLISFSAVFVAVARVGPTVAGFYRMAFGALFLMAVVAAKRESVWAGWRPLALAFAAGVFFAADLASWHRSIYYVGPGLATILANFQVFFLAAVGVLGFRERMTWRLAVSVPLAVAGLFLLVGADWHALEPTYKTGVWLGLFCAAMYTCYLLVLRWSQTRAVRLRPTANLGVITLVTAAILWPLGLAQGESFAIGDARTAGSLVAYGVLCQALGWIVISWAVTKIEASRVGLLLLLQPTLTFIWDVIFFHRPTTKVEISGAVLAIAAIYLGSTRR